MKSILKAALTMSALFVLPGCMDCSWCGKKEQNNEVIKASAPVHEEYENTDSGKCSRKGCTHNHSKDAHKKHYEDAHAQDMDDEDDVEIQSMDEDDDYMEEDEEYND